MTDMCHEIPLLHMKDKLYGQIINDEHGAAIDGAQDVMLCLIVMPWP